jgi:hypothetical protein
VNTATPTTAGNVESLAHGDDSVSEQLRQVRAAALALLIKAEKAGSAADMADAVEKAAAALKMATEISNALADRAKVTEEIANLKRTNELAPKRERSDRLRDYVAVLTPLVAIITLAATIVSQTWQFVRSERSKREDALNAQWQDAVKTISASGALSPAIVQLQPFLQSPKYARQAKVAAISLLANGSDAAFFMSLFGTIFTPINWNGMDDLVQLDRALGARGLPLATKSYDAAKNINDTTRLTKEEAASFKYVEEVIPTITSRIGSVLKTPRPAGIQVDLSATYFRSADWTGIDLDAANLEGAFFLYMDLRDVELANVTRFSGLAMTSTAWWEAKSISKPLFEFLTAGFPFKSGTVYGPRYQQYDQAAYDAAIVRLTSQLK